MALRNLKGIKELRFILCQTSPASEGLRNYIANNYKSIRQSPATIIVRECENSLPLAIATYSYGIERKANLKKLSETEIESVIAELQAHSSKIAEQIRL